MRVLLTHQWFPPDFAGGGEYLVGETAKRLQAAGLDVSVLTAGDPKQDVWEGVRVKRLPMHRYRLYFAEQAIADEARDADLVQTFTYHASLASYRAARRLKKPVVCTCLGIYADAWRGMKGPLVGRVLQWWEKKLVRLPYDRLILLSDGNREQALKFGALPERMRVIEPAVDLDLYAPIAEKQDYVLFAGKLESRKGVDELLATARALPHVPFRVLGFGPGEKQFIRDAPPNIEYLGFQTGDSFCRQFANASIFFLPSKAEGYPLVLIYAKAAGCAIVSTLLFEFAGERVAQGDQPGLIAAIDRLWSQPEKTRAYGAENLALSRKHHWDVHIDTLLDAYREVLK
ncbi:MAG: glycosyltransferase family 4 protein [Planctomycetales bacterium]